ncbi:rRNA maturation RNase YbeY [Alkaliphilus pronyensis]|uniref:Endoribonuclease YbeY n=1 Tax=Alkaliphilus pronyensis TaxID=1482732 RepID=A0A6I0FBM0_9FIRM|nr:rRNA maturation RNase YbeY [Alkaliphilus pronyensis]KAB3535355.1 rRNA maturation RNase YbeY [Alkaliphilus pronyensis]
MSLVIDNRQQDYELDNSLILLMEEAVKKSLEYEEWDLNYEVSLSLVNNNEMRELNRYYRGKDYATDVLSFPLVDNEDPHDLEEKLLGDIVLSLEKAREQAIEYQHSFNREVCFLIVHSMLHLMGYDHGNDTEKEIMRNKEDAILALLGQER